MRVTNVSRTPAPAVSHARRIPRLALVLALLLSLILPGLAISRATAQDGGSNDVPMYRGNPARTGELPGPGPDPDEAIVELWTVSTGAQIVSSPAVADGVVYAGSRDGNLYAIDAASGKLNWSAEVAANESSPTVVDGVVYIGSYNGLYAVDAATGQQNWFWRYDFGSVESSPPIVDGFIAMTDAPGHGLTLNEDVARANFKQHSSFFGEHPWEC